MADVQQERSGDDAAPGLGTWLVRFAVIYWLVTFSVAFYAYQAASGQEAHRELDLRDKGLLTADGKVSRATVATLAADAARNRACWDNHPPPSGETTPWFPADCEVYLPEEAAADAEAANWAAVHPGGAGVAGWTAAGAPLLNGAIGFAALGALALALRWIIGVLRSGGGRKS